MTEITDLLPHIRVGKGLPLVLVHGYLGSAKQWQQQIDYFSQHFDVIAPHLPGFGEASALQGHDSIDAMADSVLSLLDALEITQYHLIGHSMGGMIVQNMASKDSSRIDKLILYGTGPLGLMPNRFEPISRSKERLEAEGVEQTLDRIAATWFVDGKSSAGHQFLLEVGKSANHQAALAALEAMATWDGRDKLANITNQTLIIWGDSDKSYRWPQVEKLWQDLPNIGLAVIPSASHAASLEKPKLFQQLLEDFLLEH
jgi:pimeloyl-ACP methyl ester carboxylesterase